MGGEKLDKIPDVIINGGVGDNIIGATVLLEDMDGDGRAEIIVGAPGIKIPSSTDEGELYIVQGNEAYEYSTFSVEDRDVTSVIHGDDSDDWFGYGANVLDLNGDGYMDLAIGSRYADGKHSSNNGKVDILLAMVSHLGREKRCLTRRVVT